MVCDAETGNLRASTRARRHFFAPAICIFLQRGPSAIKHFTVQRLSRFMTEAMPKRAQETDGESVKSETEFINFRDSLERGKCSKCTELTPSPGSSPGGSN